MDIINILNRLKTHLRVHTDAEVAGYLKLTKQDIYRYKKDGKVPYNHLMEFIRTIIQLCVFVLQLIILWRLS